MSVEFPPILTGKQFRDCQSKASFASKKMAKAVARRKRCYVDLKPYRCEICGSWRLTRDGKKQC